MESTNRKEVYKTRTGISIGNQEKSQGIWKKRRSHFNIENRDLVKVENKKHNR